MQRACASGVYREREAGAYPVISSDIVLSALVRDRGARSVAHPEQPVGTSPTRSVTGLGPDEGLVRSTPPGTNVAEESVRQGGNLSH
jgi:hypothetical protein